MTPPKTPKTQLEFVKLLVRPVIQQRQNGRVVGEIVNDAVAIYDHAEIPKLVDEIKRQLAELNAAGNRAARRK